MEIEDFSHMASFKYQCYAPAQKPKLFAIITQSFAGAFSNTDKWQHQQRYAKEGKCILINTSSVETPLHANAIKTISL